MSALSKTKKILQTLRTRRDVTFPGFLGNLSGSVEANRNSDVYVTLFTGEVVTVHNSRVPNLPRLPVVIGYDAGNKNLLQVLYAREVFANPVIKQVTDHDHTWGKSTNVSWIRGEQFLPGLVMPANGTNVHYTGLIYWLDGAFRIVPEQDVDLSAAIPSEGALFVLLEVDETGVISLLEGTPVASRGVLTYADIPTPSTDKKSLKFAVKVYAGQTMVRQGLSFMDSDIVDLRWSGHGDGGGGGTPGGSDTQVQYNDDGAFAGEADFIWDKVLKQLWIGGNPISAFLGKGIGIIAEGGTTDVARNRLFHFGTQTSGPGITTGAAGGTRASPTATTNGKVLGQWSIVAWYDDHEDDKKTIGYIRAVATDDHAAGDQPFKWEIYTCPSGSDTPTLAMTITADGHIDIASGKEYRVNGAQHIHKAYQLFLAHGLNGTVPASSTYYLPVGYFGLNTSTFNFAIARPGTIKNLSFRLNGAQPASGSLVITVNKNSSNTALQITLTSTSSVGIHTNTADSFTVAAGDLIVVEAKNNATEASGLIGAVSFEFEYDTA